MSIIKPDKKSKEVENVVIKIKSNNLELYNTIDQLHHAIFDMVWYDKDYSAKSIVNKFKYDARDLFVYSGMIQDLLLEIDSEYKPLVPPKPYTINADGTVTVGD